MELFLECFGVWEMELADGWWRWNGCEKVGLGQVGCSWRREEGWEGMDGTGE